MFGARRVRRRRRRRARAPGGDTQPRLGHPAAQVGRAGPVRGLLRGEGPGLLRGRGPGRRRSARAARTSSPSRSSSAARPSSGSTGSTSTLATRDKGQNIVNIAQVFTRSGMTEVDVEGHRPRPDREAEGQEGRRLARRQRAQAVRGAEQERPRPAERRQDRRAAVRHEPPPEPRGRRRRGDDLQRARAGARAEEPGHRRPLPARAT